MKSTLDLFDMIMIAVENQEIQVTNPTSVRKLCSHARKFIHIDYECDAIECLFPNDENIVCNPMLLH